MPREIKPTNAGTKGKPPLGIPKWGWIAAAVVGIILAYVVLKKSPSSASADTGTNGPNSTPLRNSESDSGTGGGVVASPPPDINAIIAQLEALGLIGGGSGSQPGSVSGTGDSSTSTNPTGMTDTAPMNLSYLDTVTSYTPPGGFQTYTPTAPGSDYIKITPAKSSDLTLSGDQYRPGRTSDTQGM